MEIIGERHPVIQCATQSLRLLRPKLAAAGGVTAKAVLWVVLLPVLDSAVDADQGLEMVVVEHDCREMGERLFRPRLGRLAFGEELVAMIDAASQTRSVADVEIIGRRDNVLQKSVKGAQFRFED